MTQDQIREKIKEAAEAIGRKFNPEKIILFGSYAWGNPGPDSDVDILVVQKGGRPSREVAREIDGFLSPRLFPLDILVHTAAELETKVNEDRNFFLEDILRNGKVIYSQPGSSYIRMMPESSFVLVP